MTMYSDTLAGALPHNELGKANLIVETLFLALNFVCTSFRLWGRRMKKQPLAANDYLILAALLVVTARYAVIVTLVVYCGLGLHADEVERIGGPGRIVLFIKLTYVIDLMWITVVALIKTSILHLYSVIFSLTWFQSYVYGAMALNTTFWVAAFFSNVFLCMPPQKLWLPDLPGHCGNSTTFHIALAAVDLTISILVIALPMPILWNLQMKKAKKVSITFLFGLGFIIIFISAARIGIFPEIDPTDITYTFSRVAILSSLVPLLGILNANLLISGPTLVEVVKASSIYPAVKRWRITASSEKLQGHTKEHDVAYSDVSRSSNASDYTGNINK
ncbi:hypothetical protein F4808DRAFT_295133 [Astrocystis sublimbata]|nr:hypothetical protein F4808DRAFT_295133 [Astrocystis sublimbata]